jgi:hypothetical protein
VHTYIPTHTIGISAIFYIKSREYIFEYICGLQRNK